MQVCLTFVNHYAEHYAEHYEEDSKLSLLSQSNGRSEANSYYGKFLHVTIYLTS